MWGRHKPAKVRGSKGLYRSRVLRGSALAGLLALTGLALRQMFSRRRAADNTGPGTADPDNADPGTGTGAGKSRSHRAKTGRPKDT